MPDTAIHLKGMQPLLSAVNRSEKTLKRELRTELKVVAEPVRREAEELARSSIRNIGDPWSRMRTGVTTRLVYVAPVNRGVKGRGNDPRRRPNLANLLMDRAMQPALNRNQPQIMEGLESMLGRVGAEFNGA